MPQDEMGLIVEVVNKPEVTIYDDLSVGDFYIIPGSSDDNVYIYSNGREDVAVFGDDAGDVPSIKSEDIVIPVKVLGQIKIVPTN